MLRKVPSVWVALGGEFAEQTWEGPNDTYCLISDNVEK